MVYVLLNLVTAMIIDSTMELSADSKEVQMQKIEAHFAEKFGELEDMFKQIDRDDSGLIDLKELHKAMDSDKNVRAVMGDLGLAKEQMEEMFHLLDNGDKAISQDEFMGGLSG